MAQMFSKRCLSSHSVSVPQIHDSFIFQKPNKKNDLKKWKLEFLTARGRIFIFRY